MRPSRSSTPNHVPHLLLLSVRLPHFAPRQQAKQPDQHPANLHPSSRMEMISRLFEDARIPFNKLEVEVLPVVQKYNDSLRECQRVTQDLQAERIRAAQLATEVETGALQRFE